MKEENVYKAHRRLLAEAAQLRTVAERNVRLDEEILQLKSQLADANSQVASKTDLVRDLMGGHEKLGEEICQLQIQIKTAMDIIELKKASIGVNEAHCRYLKDEVTKLMAGKRFVEQFLLLRWTANIFQSQFYISRADFNKIKEQAAAAKKELEIT